ncbi:MAG: helix-turn-helix domain-containing protein [Verrucomicrobia bacterium]|nr:helix-turn-helix domain-containing protein [Verrucomicrobiota bacterium]
MNTNDNPAPDLAALHEQPSAVQPVAAPAGGVPAEAQTEHPRPSAGIDPQLYATRLAFSVREAAEILGVSEKSIRRLINRRLLKSSRALRHLRIPKSELSRYLETTLV